MKECDTFRGIETYCDLCYTFSGVQDLPTARIHVAEACCHVKAITYIIMRKLWLRPATRLRYVSAFVKSRHCGTSFPGLFWKTAVISRRLLCVLDCSHGGVHGKRPRTHKSPLLPINEHSFIALVIRTSVLHDLSVLAIRRTVQINSRSTEIIAHFWKQSGDLHWAMSLISTNQTTHES